MVQNDWIAFPMNGHVTLMVTRVTLALLTGQGADSPAEDLLEL